MARLAIITTHPIQYNAPWFRLLAEHQNIELRVFYSWHGGDADVRDAGFGQSVRWDIPLLDGYEYEVCPPSTTVANRTFWNMDSPQLVSSVEAWKPDVVLVIGWNFRSHVRCMRYFKGRTRVWFRGDSTLLGGRSLLKQWLRRRVLKAVYLKVDLALAVGQHNRQYFLEHGL